MTKIYLVKSVCVTRKEGIMYFKTMNVFTNKKKAEKYIKYKMSRLKETNEWLKEHNFCYFIHKYVYEKLEIDNLDYSILM